MKKQQYWHKYFNNRNKIRLCYLFIHIGQKKLFSCNSVVYFICSVLSLIMTAFLRQYFKCVQPDIKSVQLDNSWCFLFVSSRYIFSPFSDYFNIDIIPLRQNMLNHSMIWLCKVYYNINDIIISQAFLLYVTGQLDSPATYIEDLNERQLETISFPGIIIFLQICFYIF